MIYKLLHSKNRDRDRDSPEVPKKKVYSDKICFSIFLNRNRKKLKRSKNLFFLGLDYTHIYKILVAQNSEIFY